MMLTLKLELFLKQLEFKFDPDKFLLAMLIFARLLKLLRLLMLLRVRLLRLARLEILRFPKLPKLLRFPKLLKLLIVARFEALVPEVHVVLQPLFALLLSKLRPRGEMNIF